MEFEELQQIWDAQNSQPLYAINEKALYNRILSKKNKAYHVTNISELLLIIVNLGTCVFIFGMNFFQGSDNLFMYILSAWMFVSACYLVVSRITRIMTGQRFNRSMQGELDHALSLATYQVRLSQIGRWNIVPIGVLTLLGVWESGKSIWVAPVLVILFLIAHYAGRWEHGIYKNRKRELEILKSKLTNEAPGVIQD
jgi:hypothetical protein